MRSLLSTPSQVRVDYGRRFDKRDFVYDEEKRNYKPEVVDHVDYTKLAIAAAAGCDNVRLMKIFSQTGDAQKSIEAVGMDTSGELSYLDMSQVAGSFEEAQAKISAANKAAVAAFESLPADLRGDYSLEEFALAIKKDPTLVDRYLDSKKYREQQNKEVTNNE